MRLKFFVIGKLTVREGPYSFIGGTFTSINWLSGAIVGFWVHLCSQNRARNWAGEDFPTGSGLVYSVNLGLLHTKKANNAGR